ncbi:hypothetical protein [Actinosynnema sp. NPDC020468]|uniref:hypothetical protein n=1 Tax=Actinosynnema sp. NPDC020468 TaxID=3154488 RepID=UPI00340E7D67
MARSRAVLLGAAALVGVALLGACGQARPAVQPAAAQSAEPLVAQPEQAAPEEKPALVAQSVGDLGTVLTDARGLTLYRFDKDTSKPSTSTCDGDCAAKWPPALAESADVVVTGVDKALVGTVDRKDGTKQLTVSGWPLYRFAQDQTAGEAKGQGVGGTWFAAAPDGKKAGVSAGLVLTTSAVGTLGTVLTDKDGMTLYRFDKDSTNPSVSNCVGECAVKWPPLLVDSEKFEAQGVDKAIVGTVVRPDGKRQVTAAGWPLYTFADDKVCGDAKGQGVGGTWFVADPQGKKAGV